MSSRLHLPRSTLRVLALASALVAGCSDSRNAPVPATIIMSPVVQLTADVLPHAVTRDERGRYYAASGSAITIHSPGGALEERIVQARAGPDDFRGVGELAAVPGDSLLVVEGDGARIAVLAPGGGVVRHIRLPAGAQLRVLAVLRWPDRLLFSGYALGRSGAFVATTEGDFLVIERALVARRPPRDRRRPLYRLAPSAAGVWTAEAHSYVLTLWDSAGRQIVRRARRPSWYVVLSGRGRGGSTMPSSVRAIREDMNGRLWVYALAATERAGPAWRDARARRAGGTLDTPTEELYDTVVEVLDTNTLRVLARGRIAGYVLDVLENGDAVIAARSAEAGARATVYRLALRARGVPQP